MNAEKTGMFIASMRHERQLTQQQLADLLHVSDKAVSRWETGRGYPDINILQKISEVLEVSVAEILKGEKIEDKTIIDEVDNIASNSLNMAEEKISRERIKYVLAGFLTGIIIILTVIFSLQSQKYFSAGDKPVSIETLPDGRIVAVMKADVTGYEITDGVYDGERYVHIACYTTDWDRLLKRNTDETAYIIPSGKPVKAIFYYPGEEHDGDAILYSDGSGSYPGITTLPRLVYNMYLFLGLAGMAIMFVVWRVFRKKYYADLLLKIALFPASFTMSIIAVLHGNDEVYNAAYYFGKIILLTLCLYVLALTVFSILRDKRRNKTLQPSA